jgi:hypothetical protein
MDGVAGEDRGERAIKEGRVAGARKRSTPGRCQNRSPKAGV